MGVIAPDDGESDRFDGALDPAAGGEVAEADHGSAPVGALHRVGGVHRDAFGHLPRYEVPVGMPDQETEGFPIMKLYSRHQQGGEGVRLKDNGQILKPIWISSCAFSFHAPSHPILRVLSGPVHPQSSRSFRHIIAFSTMVEAVFIPFRAHNKA